MGENEIKTESRKIIINDSLLASGSGSVNNKTRKHRDNNRKKERTNTVIKPNTLKKTLLEKIKKHQQTEKMSKQTMDYDNFIDKEEPNKEDSKFHDNFMDSLEYLNKLGDSAKQKKKQKKREQTTANKTMKNVLHDRVNRPIPNIVTPMGDMVSIDWPSDVPNNNFDNKPIKHGDHSQHGQYGGNAIIHLNEFPMSAISNVQEMPSYIKHTNTTVPVSNNIPIMSTIAPVYNPVSTTPLYGCLKGGKNPTYRQYHNIPPLKNKTIRHRPNTIQSNVQSNIRSADNPDIKRRQDKLAELKKTHNKFRQTKRTTKKSTYKLGKIGGKVSVLIKNNNTRRKIKREHGLLRQKPLNDVKQYLYDKNLIKIGSTAPNDVLRTLYEQSILAGDINNVANDVQLHNFMNK